LWQTRALPRVMFEVAPRRLGCLVRAMLRLALVAVRLRTHGYCATRDLFGQCAGRSPPPSRIQTLAADLAWAISCLNRITPIRSACLTQSLALWSLLREAGIEAQLCVGARQSPYGLRAHAWVQLNGRVLNDDPEVAQRFPLLLPPKKTATERPGQVAKGARSDHRD
jgi:hypothetical protein